MPGGGSRFANFAKLARQEANTIQQGDTLLLTDNENIKRNENKNNNDSDKTLVKKYGNQNKYPEQPAEVDENVPKLAKIVTVAQTTKQATTKFAAGANVRKKLKESMRKIAEERLTVKQIFTRYIETSTLHGFRYTCSDTYFIRRFIWGCLMILGAIYFVVKLKEGIIEYFDYPFSTLSTLEFVDELQFPAISFCQVNQFSYSKVKNSSLYRLYLEGRLPLERNWSDPHYDIPGEQLVQEIRSTSFSIDEIFQDCDYISRDTDHPEMHPRFCSTANFTTYISQSGQVCYTLNSGNIGHQLLNVEHEGLKHGFEIMFDVLNEDSIKTFQHTGMHVIIHDQAEPPVANSGFVLSPGFKTFVSMQRIEVRLSLLYALSKRLCLSLIMG